MNEAREETVEAFATILRRRAMQDAQWAIVGGNTNPMWKGFVAEARRLLAALDAAGLVVVPREPTEAMVEAAQRVQDGSVIPGTRNMTRAALRAALSDVEAE